MNISDINTIISSVGFPIASFCACAWFIKYTYDKSQDMTTNVLSKLSDTVNALSVTLAELKEKIENIKED